ncbi:MAG: DUF177 domain-containing protein [Burkholderiaceae bacterium]
MSAKPIDPLRLDVAALAAAGGEFGGEWALATMGRLADSVLGTEPAGEAIHWQAEGKQRPVTGGEPEVWLHLTAQACVNMRCQRCLNPVAVPLDLDRWIRFVRDADQAEALDAELEDDVLELQRHMDLRELVEDELLLALPLVPRHDRCPVPLSSSAGHGDGDGEAAEGEAPVRPHPFAALAQLKKKSGG